MSRLLRVLIVEDDTDDCELLLRELRRGGFDPAWKRVETAREFRESLEHESWEIILCDYKLPRFSAHEALQVLKDTARDIPCIVVSGTIGEETAVSLMKEGAREAMKLLRSSLPATIEIRTAVRTESMILADPTQIHQLFMNLCANSAYAMQENGGILEVTLEDVELAENEVPPFSSIRPGRHVKLTLSDTGPGIDPEILDRVFDPFFTTKPPGQGTGLGLAVVHGIVKSHEGAIQVESVHGKGTCFHIFFPAIEAPAEIEAPAGAVFPGGSERILLVDDEPALAQATKLMLEQLGYRVVCKTSGIEALEAFKNRAEEAQRVDLVITDMTIPLVTGTELAPQIMALRPGVPVILCTGFSEKVSPEKVKDMGIRGFLMKPVTIHDLAATVREALDDAKAGSEGRPREIPRRKSP
ncbi:MAG: response regulator [Thermodesulfobacteriota bacterium]|nr:response regulator [Thermodesulfobacteriota bacterium]